MPDIYIETLKKRRDFLAVSSYGLRWVRPSFVLQIKPENGTNHARVGFTVTKKQGNAVQRNRIRRRLKSAAKIILSQYAKTGFDYVIIGRQEALKINFVKLTLELAEAVGKLHAINKRKLEKVNDKVQKS